MADNSIPIPSDLNGLSSDAQSQAAAEQKAEAADQHRDMLLKSILTSEASQRLARIKLVKPDKYAEIASTLLGMASRGAITEKVNEERLKQMLGNIGESNVKATKITFQRKKYADDDEDEEYDL
jgi:programmed cell death protein 5